MPATSAYSITVPRTDLTVDAQSRTGQFTVDVKNEQSTSDRVVLDIESAGTGATAADSAWFTVDRHLRPMPAGGSEQFSVTVTVPSQVAPGSFQIRPVAYSGDRPPDDTKVDGPIMTVTLPAPPTPVAQPWWRRWWPWWLIGVGVIVLLAVAVTVVIIVLSHSNGGTPSPTSSPTPKAPAMALQFSDDQEVTIPKAPDVGIGLTVQATITPTAPGDPNSFGAIVRSLDLSGTGGSWVLFTQGDQWGLSVCTPSCNAVKGTMSIGQKHIVTGTYNGSAITIYQDGTQVGTVPWSNKITQSSSLKIGRWDSSFNGVIDNVAVWNFPLSAAQVSTAATQPLKPETGLLGLWLFDETSGQEVHDSSGNGLNGFLGDSDQPDPADPQRVQATG